MTAARDRARALLEAATKGPWSVEGESVVNRALDNDDANRWDIGEIYDDSNRALIAAAPTLLAALCDELDRAEATVAKMRAALRPFAREGATSFHAFTWDDQLRARAALAETEIHDV